MEIGKKKKTGQPKSSAAKQQESLKEGTQEVGVSTDEKQYDVGERTQASVEET